MSIEAAVDAALSRNDVAEAHRLLVEAASGGDGTAAFQLGLWFLTGQLVRRDLGKSRTYFGEAAASGHQRSRLIHAALLGVGIGGPRQWKQALAELSQAEESVPQAKAELSLIERMQIDDEGAPLSPPALEKVSDTPSIRWARSLFSPDECALLREIATPYLNASMIIDPATGQARPDPIRTSEAAMFPWIDETPFIHVLNRRIAVASSTSVEQGEPLQVLRYSPGQEYRSHSDALAGVDNQRIMTVLVYLNDDFEGGETSFPAAGLNLRGELGDALIFANVDGQGRPDPHATHAGRPVVNGRKWLASRWIRERPFGR